MKKVGNVASNRNYNPQNTRPPIPIDADEADSAMERFIRQKYANGPQVQKRNNTGSTSSDDHPPPLPPKNGAKFGFRSASSIFPLSSKAKEDNEAARAEFDDYSQAPSPPRRNKHSRIFGTSLDATDDLESKMAKLRELGFSDDKRNTTVLKGLNGNLEKSIETLVRLGEGGTASSINSSGPKTPASPAGLSFERPHAASPPATSTSTNPFDRLDHPIVPLAQSTHSTGSMAQTQSHMGGNLYQTATSTNPFGLLPSQSQSDLNQAFQNMSVSSQQPLFPHHTGGLPGTQPPPVQQLYQQSMTPPVPSLPQHHYPPVIYENPGQQPQSQQIDRNNMNSNPFMQQAPPAMNTNLQSNPFMQQSVMNQTLFTGPVAQTPQPQYPSGAYNTPAQNAPSQQMNPFFNQANMQQQQQTQQHGWQSQYGYQQPQVQAQQSQPQYQQPQAQTQQPQYDQYRQQTYPMMPQQPGRLVDKRSILDLYNYPQLAPTQPQQQKPDPIQYQAPLQAVEIPQASGQISGGSNNPFMSSVPPTSNVGQNPVNGSGRSRESMMIDAGGWQNGRHSPDAWGQISGRR